MDRSKSPLILVGFIALQLFTLPPMLMLCFWITQLALDFVFRVCYLTNALLKHLPDKDIRFELEGFVWLWQLKLFVLAAFGVGLTLFVFSYRDYIAEKGKWLIWQSILLSYTGFMVWNLIALATSMHLIH